MQQAPRADGVAQRRHSPLADPAPWFSFAVLGMAVLFAGLGVDAYRHNHGAGEETLLSFSNPGHLIAAIGIAAVSVAALGGMTATFAAKATSMRQVMLGGAFVAAAWTALAVAAVGSITYIGATGATVGQTHAEDGATAAQSPSTAASTASDAQAHTSDSGTHDVGKHPTFTELVNGTDADLLPKFPATTVSAEQLPFLRNQLKRVRLAAARFPTTEAAAQGGYKAISIDAEGMGQHWINFDYLTDNEFSPSKPEGLLFSKVDDGPMKLVGVWFLQLPGSGGSTADAPPEGFIGTLDAWHGHSGICLIGSADASLGVTKSDCDDKKGTFFPEARWMMHVWVSPDVSENPDGFFAYINSDLASKQVDAVPIKDGGF